MVAVIVGRRGYITMYLYNIYLNAIGLYYILFMNYSYQRHIYRWTGHFDTRQFFTLTKTCLSCALKTTVTSDNVRPPQWTLPEIHPRTFWLQDILQLREPTITRNRDVFEVPFTIYTYCKHTVRFFVSDQWNRLQEHCKLEKNVKLSSSKVSVKNISFKIPRETLFSEPL